MQTTLPESSSARKNSVLHGSADAEKRERLQTIRNADLQSRAFVTHVVRPVLKEAEAKLTEAGLFAMATERINERSARCVLTVNRDEDAEAAMLIFEAQAGSAEPRVRCTAREESSTLAGMDRDAVEKAVESFLNDAVRNLS